MVNLHFVDGIINNSIRQPHNKKRHTRYNPAHDVANHNFGGDVRFALRSPDPFRQTVLSLATPLSSPVKSCCRASTRTVTTLSHSSLLKIYPYTLHCNTVHTCGDRQADLDTSSTLASLTSTL